MTATDIWELTARAYDPTVDSPLWKPQPKQALATKLAEQADEVLFGGAAGPGKTHWAIHYAAEEMERFPNNRGVIFRRVFPSLARSVIPRAQEALYGRAVYNAASHTFTWPNGSVLELAHLQYRETVFAHQGAEYGLVVWEEVTEFLQFQYEYLVSRLRAPADGIRPHMIATTNPGGPGHTWVKRRFVKPKPGDYPDDNEPPVPYEVWRPTATEEQPKPGTRVFIPATKDDNPALMRRDPGYVDRIAGAISNRGLRLALQTGDWDAIDAVEGALWERGWLDDGRIRPLREIDVARRVVAVDPSDGEPGKSDEYGVCVAARTENGVGAVESSHGWFGSPRALAKKTVALYHDTRADALVIEKNHGGKWLPEVIRDVDPYVNIVMVWASRAKKTRAEPVAALFEPDNDARLRYRAVLVGHEHDELEEELTTYTGEPGDVSPNRLDALVWALSELMLGAAVSDDEVQDERHEGRR